MKIVVTSVFVDDQDKALQFYTEVLGFVKKTEIPLGHFRWLTVVSPERSQRHRAGARAGQPSRPPGRSSRPSWRTASRSPRSASRTCTPNTSGSVRGRSFHPAARRDGTGHHGRVRRHLRQPDPDRAEEVGWLGRATRGIGWRAAARRAPRRRALDHQTRSRSRPPPRARSRAGPGRRAGSREWRPGAREVRGPVAEAGRTAPSASRRCRGRS